MSNQELKKEIAELKKQLECALDINAQLREKLDQESVDQSDQDRREKSPIHSVLNDSSKEQIAKFVEEHVIKNKNVNISYLPDFVERQLYKNVLNIAIGALEGVLSSTKIQIANHEITFNLTPQ